MEQELKLKKKGVSGVVVFLLIILFLAAGLVGGWYVGHNDLLPIGKEKETTEKEEKETEKRETKEESKAGECLNCKEGDTYNYTEYSNIGITTRIGQDQKSATIVVNIAEANSAYGLSLTSLGDDQYNTEIKIDNFNKKIVQVCLGGFGQAVGDEYIFYVMEDGTVECTPVFKELNENWNIEGAFKTHNAIDNLNNISHINGAEVLTGTTGHYTTVAVKKDGSYYDLHKILKK